jgi:hypothetical protein
MNRKELDIDCMRKGENVIYRSYAPHKNFITGATQSTLFLVERGESVL